MNEEKQNNPIEAGIQDWANSAGCEYRTLLRKLKKANVNTSGRSTFTADEVIRALDSELSKTKLQSEKERLKKIRRNNREASGDLINSDQVFKIINSALMPVRQRLMALPAEAASMCNPTDPQFAYTALKEWVERALPVIREAIKE